MHKVFSFGGGVQSMCALVLQAQKKIEYDYFVFADVGEDTENPATIAYVENVAIPFAKEHHIDLVKVGKQKRDGTPVSIYGNILSDNRSIGIPVYMSNGAPGNRSCTVDFKIKVVNRWMGRHNCGFPVGLGISVDEIHRARFNDPEKEYPLLTLGLFRRDCVKIIEDMGLPIPPKSSCWFCPFHRMSVWQEMRNNQPDLFEKAVKLEELINKRRENLGKDHVWLSRKLKPLDKATTDLEQNSLFEDDFCESGFCMT